MGEKPSTFVWYELMTTDVDAAERFYGEVVGWTATRAPGPLDYRILLAGETPLGGIMALPDALLDMGVPSNWGGYISVPDVDIWAEKVRAAGGQIHRAPDDIPEAGRFAVAADPHGSTFTLFCSNREMPPLSTEAPGHVGWHELLAGELEPAWDFYSGLFGWVKHQAVDMGPDHGIYQTFGSAEGAFGGMMKKPSTLPIPVWNYYSRVPALGAALTTATAAGATVINGPMQVPGGQWIAVAIDPQGGHFSLISWQP